MSQLDSKGVVGTTHLLKGQLIFVLCVCGMGVFVIWRQILEREMLIERVRVRMTFAEALRLGKNCPKRFEEAAA